MKKARVTIKHSFVKIISGADLSQRQLPFMSAKSARPGPVVWLTACSHGDEICGIVIIQELFKAIQKQLLCGTIYAFPLMNPMGFEAVSRNLTASDEDLNRSFPGSPEGSLGERIAHKIFSKITRTNPDIVLDLHTDDTVSIPYVLVDLNEGKFGKKVYNKTLAFGGQTGFAIVVDKEPITDSLSYNLLKEKIPALTFEMGEPYIINEINVTYGLQAITNILSYLNMMSPLQENFRYPLPKPYGSGKTLRYSDLPYSSKSGVVRFLAKPGDELKKDAPFARIINVFGDHQETLRAAGNSLVLGHSNSSVVYPGMPIMTFGMPPKKTK